MSDNKKCKVCRVEDTDLGDFCYGCAKKHWDLMMLDESNPSEPAPKMRWERGVAMKCKEEIERSLDNGWEPYCEDDNYIYFKRLVPCEKE